MGCAGFSVEDGAEGIEGIVGSEGVAEFQDFVELLNSKATSDFDARKRVFRGTQLLLSFQDSLITRFAFLVANHGSLDGFATSGDGFRLFHAAFIKPASRDEGVRDFAEGVVPTFTHSVGRLLQEVFNRTPVSGVHQRCARKLGLKRQSIAEFITKTLPKRDAAVQSIQGRFFSDLWIFDPSLFLGGFVDIAHFQGFMRRTENGTAAARSVLQEFI